MQLLEYQPDTPSLSLSLDLKRAFETIDRERIGKLYQYGIKGTE